MKKIFLFLFLTFLSNLKNFAADIYVNSSGASGTYNTLSGALQAANDGDRIIVSTLINLIEDVTISKSVTITSASSGSSFVLNGTMTIEAVANKEIRLIGAELDELSFTSGTATVATDCKVYLIESQVSTNINTTVTGLNLNLMYCNDTDLEVSFKYGSIIGSYIKSFFLQSGSGIAQNDTTKIIGNKFTYQCRIENQDHNFLIANNYFSSYSYQQLYLVYVKVSNSGTSNIFNNTFIIYPSGYSSYGNNLMFDNNYDYSNVNVFNNYFVHNGNSSSSTYNKHIGGNSLSTNNQPMVLYNVFVSNYGTDGGVYWNTNLSNTNHNQAVTFTGNTYSSSTGKVTAGKGINEGNNGIEFYDIDMTRNDVGTYGGPYSWDNFHNTATGKARVYNLEVPFELWMGQTPSLKADAVHQK
tara:strand:+ start:743 stop:1981 length:1239 start_codon:yes stop_codon:yes gene_type:complete